MKSSPNSAKWPNESHLESPLKNPIVVRERVRYSETDRMGVAHNKSYFEWFELGRTEYCRKKGLSYKDIEAAGYYLVVAEAFCRYRKPLRYDESFLIRVSLQEATPRKFVFRYELERDPDGLPIASGYTVHIVTNAGAEVSSLPESILDRFRG